MTRPIPAFLPDFIEKAEDVKTRAYKDDAGVWTVAAGHTGPEVHEGYVIPRSMVRTLTMLDLGTAARRLANCVVPAEIDAMSAHQYGAMLSFVFNLGIQPKWNIVALLNAGKFDDVAAEMMRFDKMHDETGKVVTVPGLEHRRLAEKMLFQTPDTPEAVASIVAPAAPLAVIQAAPVAPPPSSFTRAASTPPAAPSGSGNVFKGLMASIGSAIAAGPAIVKQISDTLSPYADHSDLVAKGISTLALFGAGLAIAALVWQWARHKQDTH